MAETKPHSIIWGETYAQSRCQCGVTPAWQATDPISKEKVEKWFERHMGVRYRP